MTRPIGKAKLTVVSGEALRQTLEQLQKIANKIEEKENRSIVRMIWEFASKKPIIGKRKE